MKKREKTFWKKQLQCKPEDFKKQIGKKLNLNFWSILVTDEILSFLLPQLDAVEELNLTLTDITDIGVSMLTSLPNITLLRLKDTEITAKCLESLNQLQKLEYLHLGTIDANCSDLIKLNKLENLKQLVVHPNDFNQEALNNLLSQNPHLELVVNSKIIEPS